MTTQPLLRTDLPFLLLELYFTTQVPFLCGTGKRCNFTFCFDDHLLNVCPPRDCKLHNGRDQPTFARSVPPAFCTMPSTQALCKYLLSKCFCDYSQLSFESYTDSKP